MTIKCNAEYLGILHKRFASTEETRYYLQGVYIYPHKDGGVVMVATDGHRIGAFRDRDGSADNAAIIHLPKPPYGAMKPKKSMSGLTATLDDDVCTITAHYAHAPYEQVASTPYEIVDATYPDWQCVVPRDVVATDTITFNATYLGDFAFKKNDNVSFTFDGKSGAALIFNESYPDFVGLLMPMRRETFNTAPDWALG